MAKVRQRPSETAAPEASGLTRRSTLNLIASIAGERSTVDDDVMAMMIAAAVESKPVSRDSSMRFLQCYKFYSV